MMKRSFSISQFFVVFCFNSSIIFFFAQLNFSCEKTFCEMCKTTPDFEVLDLKQFMLTQINKKKKITVVNQ